MADLTDVLLEFSYLVGETSIPATTTTDYTVRTAWAQAALREALRMYPFDFAKTTATISLTNGDGSLPTDAAQDPELDIRVVNSGSQDDYIFTRIDYEDQDLYEQGDYKYWLTGYEGAYVFNSKENGVASVSARYTQAAPTINASVSTPFPDATILASGMISYYRSAQDPEYDSSQDIAKFERGIEQIWSQQNRNQPQQRVKSIQEIRGEHLGEA